MTPVDEVLWAPGARRSVLSRLTGYFIAPAEEAAPGAVASAPSRAVLRAAALGRRTDLAAGAAAVTGAVRARAGARAAALLLWDPEQPSHGPVDGPASPAARALARRVAAEDLPAESRGFLARVRLPAPPAQAAAAAVRLGDLLFGVPVVLALAGPRASAFDAVLAEQDVLALVAPAAEEPSLLGVARASLEALDVPVLTVAPPAGARRALALAGLSGAAGMATQEALTA